jgi:hypothetical protein
MLQILQYHLLQTRQLEQQFFMSSPIARIVFLVNITLCHEKFAKGKKKSTKNFSKLNLHHFSETQTFVRY